MADREGIVEMWSFKLVEWKVEEDYLEWTIGACVDMLLDDFIDINLVLRGFGLIGDNGVFAKWFKVGLKSKWNPKQTILGGNEKWRALFGNLILKIHFREREKVREMLTTRQLFTRDQGWHEMEGNFVNTFQMDGSWIHSEWNIRWTVEHGEVGQVKQAQ